VTIGDRLGEYLRAQNATRTAAIVDHHLLAQRLAEARRHQPREQISAAAGNEGHNQTNRSRRVSVGGSRSAGGKDRRQQRRRSRQPTRCERSSRARLDTGVPPLRPHNGPTNRD
jgi:hypothetical protein